MSVSVVLDISAVGGGKIRNDTGRLLILAHEKVNEINGYGSSSGPTKTSV
jgi:hypothetical protein